MHFVPKIERGLWLLYNYLIIIIPKIDRVDSTYVPPKCLRATSRAIALNSNISLSRTVADRHFVIITTIFFTVSTLDSIVRMGQLEHPQILVE